MSRHHRAQRWSTHAPKLRAKLAPMLPLPCIAADCGRPVMPEQDWHVGHRQAAGLGGRPTLANVGPVHAACNLRDGGRLGARIANARRGASDRPSSEMSW